MSSIYFPQKVFLKNAHSLLKINYWVSLATRVTASFSSRCSVIRESSLPKATHKLTDLLKILTDLQFDSLCEPDPQFFLCQVPRALLFRCATLLFLFPILISSPFTPTLKVSNCTESRRKIVILSCGSTFPPYLTSGLLSVYFPSPSYMFYIVVWLIKLYLLLSLILRNRKSTFAVWLF